MSADSRFPEDELEEIKNELESISDLVKELIERVNALIRSEQYQEDSGRNEIDRRLHVLKEIYSKGGVISRQEFHQIGERYGYPKQALGCFFVGKRKPLTMISGDKVALTPNGERELRRHRLTS